jgi:hypothetical protein
MIDIGYSYRGENGIPRRHYFVKGDPRTHHVHMIEIASDGWKVTLRFRDLLRTHPDLASEYDREKKRLARVYFDDREAYQREKDKVVESILGESKSREPDVPSPIDLHDPADARAWESTAQARPGRAEMFQRFLGRSGEQRTLFTT